MEESLKNEEKNRDKGGNEERGKDGIIEKERRVYKGRRGEGYMKETEE